MAIVLAFRLAIITAPLTYRVVNSGQPSLFAQSVWASRSLLARLSDPGESDEDLSAAVSDATGTVATVATYTGTFELRKLQVLFGRTSGGSLPEDDAIITFHFLRLAGGSPSDAWVSGDFTAVETAFGTMWGVLKQYTLPATALRQLRWYRTGPQVDTELGGPGRTGPPVRVFDSAVAGTGTASGIGAPQVAYTITEKTADKTAWGRFYVPGPFNHAAMSGTYGRIASSVQTVIGNAADAFYEACLANGTPVVVYSSAKAERPKASGGTLPAKGARALSVDELQVDDLYDVIRSRRYSTPLLRLLRTVG